MLRSFWKAAIKKQMLEPPKVYLDPANCMLFYINVEFNYIDNIINLEASTSRDKN